MNFDTQLEKFVDQLNKIREGHYDTAYNTYPKHLRDKLEVAGGRKYLKVIMVGENTKSVYMFVEKETGDILKAASWSSPAKGARGNIFTTDLKKYNSAAIMFGGWLYKTK